MTSLIYASKEGHLDVVRALLDRRADILAKNNYGKIVIYFYAIWSCFVL